MFVNLSSAWCFVEEDMIGRVVRICKLCDSRARELRTTERWLLRFQIMLHEWSSDIPFGDVDSSSDEEIGIAHDT